MPFIPNGVKDYFYFEGGIHMKEKQKKISSKMIQLVNSKHHSRFHWGQRQWEVCSA